MGFLTIVALVTILGVGALIRMHPPEKSDVTLSPDVKSDFVELEATASPQSSSAIISGKSDISIKVDTNAGGNPVAEKLIFPGAVLVSDNGERSVYETDTNAEAVFDWYASEMEKRSFTIRNKVKTRANEKVKAVVAGTSASTSLTVTIDQKDSVSKTQITLE